MAEIALECPHCATERAGFRLIDEVRISNSITADWNTFWICGVCQNGIVVKLGGHSSAESPSKCQGDPRNYFAVMEVHPKPQDLGAPEHVPELIAQDFKEAQDNLRRGNWTSAGVMFRKVLQRATTSLAQQEPEFTKLTLAKRVAQLADNLLITPGMRDWAEIIRLDGNEAAHEEDEPFTEVSATQLKDFTELFLIYAFTLPERVRRAREEAAY